MKHCIVTATIALTTSLCAAPADDIVFSDMRSAEDAALFPSKTDQFVIVDVDDDELVTREPKKNIDTVNEKQLEEYAHTFLKKQLTLHQLTLNQLPKEKQVMLNVVIKNLCSQCRKECKKSKASGVKKQHFNTLLKASLEKIYNRVASGYVIESGLANAVDNVISALFTNAGIALRTIPTEMKREFTDRRNNILVKLKELMLARKTDAVALSDIEGAVNKSFTAFIDRIQHVFIWNWVNAELVNLSKETKEQKKTSSIKPNPESKKIGALVKSIRKKV